MQAISGYLLFTGYRNNFRNVKFSWNSKLFQWHNGCWAGAVRVFKLHRVLHRVKYFHLTTLSWNKIDNMRSARAATGIQAVQQRNIISPVQSLLRFSNRRNFMVNILTFSYLHVQMGHMVKTGLTRMLHECIKSAVYWWYCKYENIQGGSNAWKQRSRCMARWKVLMLACRVSFL